MENGAAEKKQSTLSLVFSLPANFWYANLMEIFERLAFFGVRAIAPLYLVAKSGDNGLGLTYTQKGTIYAWWALIQCLVPMVSGGYTERYGYRKSLVVAFIVNIIGYLCMANSKPIADFLGTHGYESMGYWVFLVAACCVAFGTAIFKPPCHGTVAKTTDENTSSMGWGLFYWVVNIGGALAPMAAAQLRGEIDWHYVFYGAAIVTAFNFLPLFILYREPKKDAPKEDEEHQNAIEVFFNSIDTIFRDARLMIFLLIFSCFWLMFMQLWDLLPNFIDEWVDTSDVAPFFGWVSDGWVLPNGQAKPEMLINIDAIAIIALVLVISWLIRKINKVAAMIIGMVISLFGFVGAGYTTLGWLCCLMIFIFAIGEMTCSPTFSAYIGLIAPKDKKALYMGYSNIPFAIGWALGNLVGGYFYDHHGAKAELAMKYLGSETKLVAQAARAMDWSDALERVPTLLDIERGEAFALAQQEMGVDADTAAQRLRDAFRYDRGQIENLALLHLALHPDNRSTTIKNYAKVVNELASRLQGDSERFVGEVAKAIGDEKKTGDAATPVVASQPANAEPASQPSEDSPPVARADAELPAAADILEDADEINKHTVLSRQLTRGEVTIEEIGLPNITQYLPTIVGKKRDEALDGVRELVNKGLSGDEKKLDTEIIAMLWEQHGDDAGVLNNLALEYLAQATDRISEAVANRDFKYSADELDKRMKEIERQIGIGKAKAFGALSAALGTSEAEVRAKAAELEIPDGTDDERIFVYLAMQGGPRYHAVRDVKWRYNRDLLRALIRDDDAAREIVLAEIDKVGFIERIVLWIRHLLGDTEEEGTVTEEGINYHRLATKGDLIQKALTAKDWASSPREAKQLMAMNPGEAWAAASANEEVAKQTLWGKYRPYMVWVYLGLFGLGGTVGMIIFYLATRRALGGNNNEEQPAAA